MSCYHSEGHKPELNYGYKQISFNLGKHTQLCFGDNSPEQMKKISKLAL